MFRVRVWVCSLGSGITNASVLPVCIPYFQEMHNLSYSKAATLLWRLISFAVNIIYYQT